MWKPIGDQATATIEQVSDSSGSKIDDSNWRSSEVQNPEYEAPSNPTISTTTSDVEKHGDAVHEIAFDMQQPQHFYNAGVLSSSHGSIKQRVTAVDVKMEPIAPAILSTSSNLYIDNKDFNHLSLPGMMMDSTFGYAETNGRAESLLPTVDAESLMLALTGSLPSVMNKFTDGQSVDFNNNNSAGVGKPALYEQLLRPLLMLQTLLSHVIVNSITTATNAAARFCPSRPWIQGVSGPTENTVAPNVPESWDQTVEEHVGSNRVDALDSRLLFEASNNQQQPANERLVGGVANDDSRVLINDQTLGSHISAALTMATETLACSPCGPVVSNFMLLVSHELERLQALISSLSSMIGGLTDRLERTASGLSEARKELHDAAQSKLTMEQLVASIAQHLPIPIRCQLAHFIPATRHPDLHPVPPVFVPPPPPHQPSSVVQSGLMFNAGSSRQLNVRSCPASSFNPVNGFQDQYNSRHQPYKYDSCQRRHTKSDNYNNPDVQLNNLSPANNSNRLNETFRSTHQNNEHCPRPICSREFAPSTWAFADVNREC